MRIFFPFIMLAVLFSACDENRVYEKNNDFQNRYWVVNEKPAFEFDIAEDQYNYNLYCDIRNTVSFPYSRLFFNYQLEDSAGVVLQKKLTEKTLFDPKTGKPFGSSGLGDIYDHRVTILSNYHFPYKGKYRVRFEQYMRLDTLPGVLAVGLRVEKRTERGSN